MTTCTDFERLIARCADDADGLAADERRRLDAHLLACASCRAALDAQRDVAAVLAARTPSDVAAGFHARLSARLGGEGGWLPVVNWRAWTVGLVPVAGALLLAAWLLPGAASRPSSETRTTTSSALPAAAFDTWASSTVRSPAAAAFLRPETTGDSLVEIVLTNSASNGTESNVR